MTTILWRGRWLDSSEFCDLSAKPGGHRLSGIVLLAIDGRPGQIRYAVDLDEAWRTDTVEVTTLIAGEDRHVRLTADAGGHWRLDGSPVAALDGCIDADLGFTPATNTLPIRRLGLQVGETAEIRAAWMRFPTLTVQAAVQFYERLDERLWRYRSGTFAADLTVDPSGLVVAYGEEVWTAVAHSDLQIRGGN